MKTVNGVVIALYKNVGGYPRYAILKREKNWDGWELVKGRMDDGEDPSDAAKREIEEETGIQIEEIEKLDDIHEWEYERNGETHHATYHTFLAKASDNAHIDTDNNHVDEHSKGHFLNLRDATDILTHDNQRQLLHHVHKQIQEEV